MQIRLFTLIPLFVASLQSHAQSPLTFAHALGTAAMGIIGGRQVAPGEFDGIVKVTSKDKDNKVTSKDKDNKDVTCTGFIIEGCVITSGHCLYKNSDPEIGLGVAYNTPFSKVSQIETMYNGFSPATDLAVLKLIHPPDKRYSQPRIAIADDRPEIDSKVDIAGFGFYGTEEQKDKDGNVREVNVGIGTKRWGQTTVVGYPIIDGEDTANSPLIRTDKSPNQVAMGDSGGPMMIGNKIYGVATYVVPKYALRPGESPPPIEDLLVKNITHGAHLSLAKGTKAREWLDKTLDTLDCAGNTPEAIKIAIIDLFRDQERSREQITETFLRDLRPLMSKLLYLENPDLLRRIIYESKNGHERIITYETGLQYENRPVGRMVLNMKSGEIRFEEGIGVAVTTINRAELMKNEEGNNPNPIPQPDPLRRPMPTPGETPGWTYPLFRIPKK